MENSVEILWQDEQLAVCIKPVGISSEEENGDGMPCILQKQLGGYVYTLHRLDKAVGGVMVYAKTEKSAAAVSRQIAEHSFKKCYLAVCKGVPEMPSGRYTDLLLKDGKKKKAFVVKSMRKGVKTAELEYRLVKSAEYQGEQISLVEIKLLTGRFHQIRVQFASRQMPLLGDGKYGSRIKCNSIALWSRQIELVHPVSREKLVFEKSPPVDEFPWLEFSKEF